MLLRQCTLEVAQESVERLASADLDHPPDRAMSFFFLTAIVFFLALVLGGGTIQGLASDAIVEFASLPLLIVAMMRLVEAPRRQSARLPLVVVVAILLLPLVQLIPLPPVIWSHLPGRGPMVETFGLIGQELPWWPISLEPKASWRAFLSLLPATAIFLAMLSIDMDNRRKLTLGLTILAGVSVLLGLTQVMQGPQSPLYFYQITNRGVSAGFFANRNHYAALLCAAIPLSLAWAIHFANSRVHGWRLRALAAGLLPVLLLLGAAMSLSRAGAVLAMVAFGSSLLLLDFGSVRTSRPAARHVMLGIGLVAVILVANYALLGLMSRFLSAPTEEGRGQIWEITQSAAAAMFPAGAGFGTFQTVYRWFDRPEAIIPYAYVNRAHNDWLELLLEAGLPALIVIALFLWWFARSAWRVWRAEAGEETHFDLKLARAASLSILVLLLHSFVDYPLRTLAVQATFAFLCALLVEPVIESRHPIGQGHHTPRRAPRPANRSGKRPRPPSPGPSRPQSPPAGGPAKHRPSRVWTD